MYLDLIEIDEVRTVWGTDAVLDVQESHTKDLENQGYKSQEKRNE